ncbi:hypothetical protein ACFSKW_18530 [Nonomuraea mangrovi]|uniref:Uncharacterized protein n=1 Tax=Nonomuraea mangrovi TaxID=2316207 RepID=A0ABW4SW07_9ACTN
MRTAMPAAAANLFGAGGHRRRQHRGEPAGPSTGARWAEGTALVCASLAVTAIRYTLPDRWVFPRR